MSIRRNTTYNLLGSLIPLGLSLFTIPMYMRLIGEARYGVLAIAWLLLGYFGLFDLGLGRATAQRIAMLRDSTTIERAQTFWTAFSLNIGLGVIGGLLVWPIASYFFGNVFKIEVALRSEMQAAVPWLILAVPVATLTGVLTGALQGRERFFDLNLISVTGTVLFQSLPLFTAVFLGAGLNIILPAALFARFITLLLLFMRCRKDVFSGHRPTFDRSQAVQLLRFGGWVTVSSFVGPMMVILDRFIIGAITGAKAVAFYTVPFQLGQRSTILSNSLAGSLFPRFAALKPLEEQRLANEGLGALVVVMTPLVAAGILFVKPFLAWWITPEFSQQSALVGQVVLLGFWVNGFAKVPLAQLQARGRPDLVAKCHLCEVLPYFVALYVGLHFFGLVGAAAVFSLRVLVDFVLLANFAGILYQSLRILLTPTALLAAAIFIATSDAKNSLFFCLTAVHLSGTTIWAWQQAPKPLRELLIARLKPLTSYFVKT